jgi:hypothetical protein
MKNTTQTRARNHKKTGFGGEAQCSYIFGEAQITAAFRITHMMQRTTGLNSKGCSVLLLINVTLKGDEDHGSFIPLC